MTRRCGVRSLDVASPWSDGVVSPYLTFHGTLGRDSLRGTAAADTFDMSQGGNDTVKALGGDDTVYFGAAFTGEDRFNGGNGFDTVTLDGDYSAGIEVRAESLVKIESLTLMGGSYLITGELGFNGVFDTLVDGALLTAGQSLTLQVASAGDLRAVGGAGDDLLYAALNGSASILLAGDGDDTLIGGSGATLFAGSGGADRIEMSTSADVAYYGSTSESIGKLHDTIDNFAASGGRIELGFDSDASTVDFDSDFHFGKTADRTGDILIKYDAGSDGTIVKVFTDADHKADFVLHLTGDVPLTSTDFIFG